MGLDAAGKPRFDNEALMTIAKILEADGEAVIQIRVRTRPRPGVNSTCNEGLFSVACLGASPGTA
jgi:hypothetical protein